MHHRTSVEAARGFSWAAYRAPGQRITPTTFTMFDVQAAGARIGTVVTENGQARILDCAFSAYADPASANSIATAIYTGHDITLAANVAGSARAGRNTQVYNLYDGRMPVAPRGSCVHLITPVSGGVMVSGPFALLPRSGLVVFDTDEGQKNLKYCRRYGTEQQLEWLTVDTA